MSFINEFPKKLLEKSAEERYDYFYKFTVGHPMLSKVSKEVIERINNPAVVPLIDYYWHQSA